MSIQENSQSEMSIDEQLRSEMSVEEDFTADIGEPAPFPEVEIETSPTKSPDVDETSSPQIVSELPSSILPSNADILGYYKFKKVGSNASINTIGNEIAEELIGVWTSIGIPTQNLDYVKKDVKKIIGKYM